MKFTRTIGKIDPALISRIENKLSSIFLEMGIKPDNVHVGDGMGGDPLLFALLQPIEHIATMNIPTAGTDGRRYYWNPIFVDKLTNIGLRIVCAHEAWHAIYMHPQRRGGRIPKLWNYCVDYIVNNIVMEDLTHRKKNAKETFIAHLGNYITVEEYADTLRNPFAPPKPGSQQFIDEKNAATSSKLPDLEQEGPLTEEEMKEMEKAQGKSIRYFADPDLAKEMRKPEKLYDYFYSLLPKCPDCGKVGMYKIPSKGDGKGKGGSSPDKSEEEKKEEEKDQSEEDGKDEKKSCGHDHSKDGDQPCPDHAEGEGEKSEPKKNCNHNGKGCGTCEDDQYVDIFDFGDTLDDHMDANESPEKMGQRLADAIETAKRMNGHIPAGLQEELGKLTAPVVRWKDVVRAQLIKARDGNARNDWSRFKTRPLFAGLLVPKRIDNVCSFVCLLDCSGSMSTADCSYGVSQLQSLDERTEGILVPADATIYWDKAVKLNKMSQEELAKIKIVGRGGTMFSEFFTEYPKKLKTKANFLILITDGYLGDIEIANMRDPGIPVYWLITAPTAFTPPFGKVFQLRS